MSSYGLTLHIDNTKLCILRYPNWNKVYIHCLRLVSILDANINIDSKVVTLIQSKTET